MNGLIPTYAQNEKLSEATTPRTCAAQTVYASKSNIPASYATVSRCSVQAQTGNLSNDYEYRTTSLKHGATPDKRFVSLRQWIQDSRQMHESEQGKEGCRKTTLRYADFLWRTWNLILEYDSDAFHASKDRLGLDSARRAELQREGFSVITLTNHQLSSVEDFSVVTDALLAKMNRADRTARIEHYGNIEKLYANKSSPLTQTESEWDDRPVHPLMPILPHRLQASANRTAHPPTIESTTKSLRKLTLEAMFGANDAKTAAKVNSRASKVKAGAEASSDHTPQSSHNCHAILTCSPTHRNRVPQSSALHRWRGVRSVRPIGCGKEKRQA